MISFKMFEAFIKDTIWRDKVADLLGPEWDNGGDKVYQAIWDDIRVTWGRQGADFISDFIYYRTGGRNSAPSVAFMGNKIKAVSIENLWETLNMFFSGKEDE